MDSKPIEGDVSEKSIKVLFSASIFIIFYLFIYVFKIKYFFFLISITLIFPSLHNVLLLSGFSLSTFSKQIIKKIVVHQCTFPYNSQILYNYNNLSNIQPKNNREQIILPSNNTVGYCNNIQRFPLMH